MSIEVPDGATQRHQRLMSMLYYISTHEPEGCNLMTIQGYMITAWGLKFKTTGEMVRECEIAGLIGHDGAGRFHLTSQLGDLAKRLERVKHERTKPSK